MLSINVLCELALHNSCSHINVAQSKRADEKIKKKRIRKINKK